MKRKLLANAALCAVVSEAIQTQDYTNSVFNVEMFNLHAEKDYPAISIDEWSLIALNNASNSTTSNFGQIGTEIYSNFA